MRPLLCALTVLFTAGCEYRPARTNGGSGGGSGGGSRPTSGATSRTSSQPATPSATAAAFDHGPWDKLLRKYVERSRTDYESWKGNVADLAALDAYLAACAQVEPEQLPGKGHIVAFWINVYNAWTIRSMIKVYPTKSILDHAKDEKAFHIWKNNPLTIAGKPHNLDEIEKVILLQDLGEKRAHFAVNCASIGCPPLRSQAWTAANLEEGFTTGAELFFATPSNFKYDKAANTVFISQLFDWYKGDFGAEPAKVMAAFAPYIKDPEARKAMESGAAALKYLDYDWNINERPKNAPAAASIDHGPWDKLLRRYVVSSRVDYEAWNANAQDLAAHDAYLAACGQTNPEQLASRAERVAFWINVYNAWTIRSILKVYPTKSILDHAKDEKAFHIWKNNPLTIAGKPYNLDGIEKGILLHDMAEPRAHFAVNCASIGCPPLRSEAWTAANLEASFTQSAELFFSQPGNFKYDKAANTVYISQLFDWYKADFGTEPAKVMAAFAPYVQDPEARKAMASGAATLKYLDYDWGINKKGA